MIFTLTVSDTYIIIVENSPCFKLSFNVSLNFYILAIMEEAVMGIA